MAVMTARDSIEILVVEDSPADARLTQEALREKAEHANVHIVPDAEQALTYLTERKADRRPPVDLILLDLNLPGLDGRELLRQLKDNTDFRKTPVVIVSTSSAPEDIQSAYKMGASAYIVKPVDAEEYFWGVRLLTDLWLNIASLPPLE